jgi:hypothetical protein
MLGQRRYHELATICAVFIALLVLPVSAAYAHSPSTARVVLNVDGRSLTGDVRIALRDLDAAIGLDGDHDGTILWSECLAAEPRIVQYVRNRVDIADADSPQMSCLTSVDQLALVNLSDATYASVLVNGSCASEIRTLSVGYRLMFDTDAQHRGFVEVNGQSMFVRDRSTVQVSIAAPANHSFGSFLVAGILHIWDGLDHILFLLCLIVPSVYLRKTAVDNLRVVLRSVLEIVTAFTLAHSITLVVSAVGLFTLPSRYVETAIALSVVAAAVNNLTRAIDARWAVAFALGLLHGFGFSTVLIDAGLDSKQLIAPMLGFNIGVELGQAAIVAVVVPVLFIIRKTKMYLALLWGGSAAVAIIASYWAVQRWFS